MPLTSKGKKIKAAMVAQYGQKKGTSVFYASINKGNVKGAEKGGGKVSAAQMAEDEVGRARLPSSVRASYQRSGMSGGAAVGGSGQGYGGKVMHPMMHAKKSGGGRW